MFSGYYDDGYDGESYVDAAGRLFSCYFHSFQSQLLQHLF
jgi:hypothetical protein